MGTLPCQAPGWGSSRWCRGAHAIAADRKSTGRMRGPCRGCRLLPAGGRDGLGWWQWRKPDSSEQMSCQETPCAGQPPPHSGCSPRPLDRQTTALTLTLGWAQGALPNTGKPRHTTPLQPFHEKDLHACAPTSGAPWSPRRREQTAPALHRCSPALSCAAMAAAPATGRGLICWGDKGSTALKHGETAASAMRSLSASFHSSLARQRHEPRQH